MEVANKRRRFDGVHATRFLAALLVLFTHASFYTHERLDPSIPVWKGGIIGVDIFFVISGFVMVIATRRRDGSLVNWADFLRRRIMRVFPLYWLATTVNVVILIAMPSTVLHSDFEIPEIIKSYFLIPTLNIDGRVEPLLGVAWTLYFESFFYLLFALALLVTKNPFRMVAITLCMFAGAYLLRPSPYPLWMFYFDPIVLEFLAGMFIARYVTLIKVPAKISVATIVVALLLCVFLHLLFPGLPDLIGRGLPAMLMVAAVVTAEPIFDGKIPDILMKLGSASYSIYLFHPIVAPAVPFLLNKLHFHVGYLSVLGSILCAIVFPSIIYALVEVPALRRVGVDVR